MIQSIISPTFMESEEVYEDAIEIIGNDIYSLFNELELNDLQRKVDLKIQDVINEYKDNLNGNGNELLKKLYETIHDCTINHCNRINSSFSNRFFIYEDFTTCVIITKESTNLMVPSDEYGDECYLVDDQKEKVALIINEQIKKIRSISKSDNYIDELFNGVLCMFIVSIHYCLYDIPFTSYILEL